MIIDASVAFKWVLTEDQSDRADALIGAFELKAPSLLLAEIGNALWRKVVQGEMASDRDFSTHLGLVEGLVEVIDFMPVLPRAIELAVDLRHPIYDCVYLALAEAESDKLVTADSRFAAKVENSSLSRFLLRLSDVG